MSFVRASFHPVCNKRKTKENSWGAMVGSRRSPARRSNEQKQEVEEKVASDKVFRQSCLDQKSLRSLHTAPCLITGLHRRLKAKRRLEHVCTYIYGFTATQSTHVKVNCTAVSKIQLKNVKRRKENAWCWTWTQHSEPVPGVKNADGTRTLDFHHHEHWNTRTGPFTWYTWDLFVCLVVWDGTPKVFR